jgi:hypothetical protein
MATRVSELKARIAELEGLEMLAGFMMARAADFTAKTGRIPGCDSRYEVSVWFRNSGIHAWQFRFIHPRQADSVHFGSDALGKADAQSGVRCDTDENAAVRDLWFRVAQAIRQHDRPSLAA